MKYIKKFENLSNIEYSVGDIVACVDPDFDEIGKKFKIFRIYTYNKIDDIDDFPDKVYLDYITSDQITKYNFYVNVQNMGGFNSHFGISAKKFRSIENANIIIASNKYNL